MNMLTLITFIPLLGAVIILALPKDNKKAIQSMAIGSSAISFILSMVLFFLFDFGLLFLFLGEVVFIDFFFLVVVEFL